MSVDLMDPARFEELAQIVDAGGKDSSLEEFIRSLALPGEQAGAMVDSLAQLPPCSTDKEGLPTRAPDLVRMAFWS